MRVGQRLELIHTHSQFQATYSVLRKLQNKGHQAVLAGGCVRDAWLGFKPKDFDIATSATPDEVEGLFESTQDLGKRFGTILVLEGGGQFEVTTFRSEGSYQDGRHPNEVTFSSMQEDAQRRDFTINALFYDPSEESIFDFVDGITDLKKKILRTVGAPHERLNEDYLRMLRAVRFVSQLGFQLDKDAHTAIHDLHFHLSKIAKERILNEMQRFLIGPYLILGLSEFLSTRLHEVCFPEIEELDIQTLNRFPTFFQWENTLAALAWLLKFDPEPRLRDWKSSRKSIQLVQDQLVSLTKLLNPRSEKADRMQVLADPNFHLVLNIISGLGFSNRVEEWVKEYLDLSGKAGKLPEPYITGQDLQSLGVRPGPQFGDILKKEYRSQLNGEIRSREDALLKLKSRLSAETK